MTAGVHKITVQGGGSFFCSESERILIAMERAGQKSIPVGCRNGGCGICKVRVLAGDYVRGKMSVAHIGDDAIKNNYALACRVYPRGEMIVEAVKR